MSLTFVRLFSVAVIAVIGFSTAQAQRLSGPRQRGQDRTARTSQRDNGKDQPTLPQSWMDQLQWRSIGPANMGGRIPAMTVFEANPSHWWVATASGGLLKTVNNGTTFEHQFDFEDTISIGDVKVFQGDENILWVGTGEANPRNSVSWGNGIYKSVDGGKNWTHLGLDKTAHIGRIALHPTDKNIAYIGALGRLWGHNQERGVYKTTDGGKNWEQVLAIDEKTGIIDLQMHPTQPEILFAAAYERMRDGFDGNDPAVKFGEKAGIYRTTDSGKTWERLTNGLPSCKMGRIGLEIYRKDPSYIYAVIETEKIGQWPENAAYGGFSGEDADVGARLTNITKDGPFAKGGLETNDIVVEVDGKPLTSYDDLIAELRSREASAELKLRVVREREFIEKTVKLALRPELVEIRKSRKKLKEGETIDANQLRRGSPYAQSLGGQNPNLQSQQGNDGAEYGGIYRSKDGGDSWERINSLNPRPMYYSQIRVDPSDNQNIWVLGTALYKSTDGGETFTGDGAGGNVHVDHHSMWIDPKNGAHIILGNDGGIYVTYDSGENWDHHNHVAIGQFYHVGISHNRDYRVYGGLQDNGSWGAPVRVGDNAGPVNDDWARIGGGDGFVCLVDPNDPNQLYYESQNGGMGRRNLETGERGFMRPRPPRGVRYRFNWKTPFALSLHNPEVYYTAGNYVFRSLRKGDNLRQISPEITRTDRGTGSALAESPRDERVVMVGTTDGMLWVTKNMGEDWIDIWNNPEELAPKRQTRNANRNNQKPQESSAKKTDSAKDNQTGNQPSDSKSNNPETEASAESKNDLPADETDDANKPGESSEMNADGDEASTDSKDASQESNDSESSGSSDDAAQTNAGNDEEDPSAEEENDSEIAELLKGYWEGKFDSAALPAARRSFNLIMKLNDQQRLIGSYRSTQSDGDITRVTLDLESGEFVALAETSGSNLQFQATLDGEELKGKIDVNDGTFSIDFTAKRVSKTPEAPVKPEQTQGKTLKELLPQQMWISSITASKFVTSRFYITVDGHRSDAYEPFVLVTENYGQTWEKLTDRLPKNAGSARVIREDISTPEILYLGCEMGAWVSIDRGTSWTPMNTNLPKVSVHEIAQHPTSGEIVAGTHGRSIWILDVTPLRQFTKERIAEEQFLFSPNTVLRWPSELSSGNSGTRRFVGQNPTGSAEIYYSLKNNAGDVDLVVTDVTGKLVARLDGEPSAGLHKLNWSLRRQSFGNRRSLRVPNGEYRIGLEINGDEVAAATLDIESAPDAEVTGQALNEEDLFEALYQSELEEEYGDDKTERIEQ